MGKPFETLGRIAEELAKKLGVATKSDTLAPLSREELERQKVKVLSEFNAAENAYMFIHFADIVNLRGGAYD